MRLPLVQRKRVPEFLDEVPQGGGSAAEWCQVCGGRQMRNHRYVHGRGKDLEGGALAMDIQGIREGALFAMHNMQDVWSFLIYRVFLLAGMPACYIYRQQEGRHRSRPWQEGV